MIQKRKEKKPNTFLEARCHLSLFNYIANFIQDKNVELSNISKVFEAAFF